MTTLSLLCIALVLLVVHLTLEYVRNILNLPPGPLPLPFVGNIMPKFVHPGLCNWYKQLREKYGDVFTVYTGRQPTVVVNGYEAVSELLIQNRAAVCTRFSGVGILNFLHDNRGLVWSNTKYKVWRKICLEGLKMDDDMAHTEHMDTLLSTLDSKEFDIRPALYELVASDMYANILGGIKYQKNSCSKWKELFNLHNELIGMCTSAEMVHKYPILTVLPGYSFHWNKFQLTKEKLHAFIKKEIILHEHTLPTDGSNRDILDVYLRQQIAEGLATSDVAEADLIATVMQLMLAGLDAVHSAIVWLLLYVITVPDVQTRIFEEIKEEIGLDTWPSWKHSFKMPYTMAAIQEVVRISNLSFTSLPYETTTDVKVRGQNIPAGSCVSVNFVSVHKDPQIFPEPDKFKPERFLVANNKSNHSSVDITLREKNANNNDSTYKSLYEEDMMLNNENYCDNGIADKPVPHFKRIEKCIPFSIGRRSCIGEHFSKRKVFLTVVSMLQKFKLSTIDGVEYSHDSGEGFLSTPKSFKLRAEKRSEHLMVDAEYAR